WLAPRCTILIGRARRGLEQDGKRTAEGVMAVGGKGRWARGAWLPLLLSLGAHAVFAAAVWFWPSEGWGHDGRPVPIDAVVVVPNDEFRLSLDDGPRRPPAAKPSDADPRDEHAPEAVAARVIDPPSVA